MNRCVLINLLYLYITISDKKNCTIRCCLFSLRIDLGQQILPIQVERLMMSVIAFVITVDWLCCEANCQALLGWDDIILSGKRCVVLSICMSWRLKSR